MLFLKKDLNENYSPLYFLASLGNGGLAVSFFMYLMFLVPHKGVPMAAFMHWVPLVKEGNYISALILMSIIAFSLLTFFHFKLLFWNIKELKKFKETVSYKKLKSSNAEVTLMAIPLTFAMTINVFFIIGSLFVPQMWNIAQYLFPFATLGFAIIGFWALKIYGAYLSRLFTKGGFNTEQNNNFSQLLAPFAFAMVAVGLAAPAAMSHNLLVSGVSTFLSVIFSTITVSLTLIWLFISFKTILKKGFDEVSSPTLWILIPILTLLGITFVRQTMGLHHNFGMDLSNSFFIQPLSLMFGFQIIIGLFGYKVMKDNNYFSSYVKGEKNSPASFGLICPGVAFVVLGFFFVNYVLIGNEIIDKYSIAHMITLLPLVVIQLITTNTLFKLSKKLIIMDSSKEIIPEK